MILRSILDGNHASSFLFVYKIGEKRIRHRARNLESLINRELIIERLSIETLRNLLVIRIPL
jgi:hypothetical protein